MLVQEINYKRSALPLPLQQKKSAILCKKLLNVGFIIIIDVITTCTPFCYTLRIAENGLHYTINGVRANLYPLMQT